MSRIEVSAAAAALVVLSVVAARAEPFPNCSVTKTSDGFAALRAGPSVSAKLIAKARPGDTVVVDVKDYERVRSGGWVRVSHFAGEFMPTPGEPDYAKVRRGWMWEKLVDDCG